MQKELRSSIKKIIITLSCSILTLAYGIYIAIDDRSSIYILLYAIFMWVIHWNFKRKHNTIAQYIYLILAYLTILVYMVTFYIIDFPKFQVKISPELGLITSFFKVSQADLAVNIIAALIWTLFTLALAFIYTRKRKRFAYSNITNVVLGLKSKVMMVLYALKTANREFADLAAPYINKNTTLTEAKKQELISMMAICIDHMEAIVFWREQVTAIHEYSLNCGHATLIAVRKLKTNFDYFHLLLESLKRTHNRFSDSPFTRWALEHTNASNPPHILTQNELDIRIVQEREATLKMLYHFNYLILQNIQLVFETLPITTKIKLLVTYLVAGINPAPYFLYPLKQMKDLKPEGNLSDLKNILKVADLERAE